MSPGTRGGLPHTPWVIERAGEGGVLERGKRNRGPPSFY